MDSLPDVIQALLKPGAYAARPLKIELMQTQMSFILLTGEFVYKIKKPVDLGYLDYTTLEKRHDLCRKEVELNRRLCLETYLGVVPITKGAVGIAVDGDGEVVEYAVKMRYLPQERMLNVLLGQNGVTEAMMQAVAAKLADFHRRAATGQSIAEFGKLETIGINTSENFSQTEKYFGKTIMEERFNRIKAYTEKFMTDNTGLFSERVTGGRIRDCHGDLHAAHVCFTNGICIYDCIEFNDRFRYCDVASEIAFLAMDLDNYGRADLSQSFVDAYVTDSGDEQLHQLLNFYKCYRAYVRGKVESFKLDDPHISEEAKADIAVTAGKYFELAESYIS
jgi:aminoglycoside phosphotransferase family enzyme